MKGKKYIKKMILNTQESGYILAFSLILIGVLLVVSLSISRIITKEIFFSQLIDNNRSAYFAADSGIECAYYLDNVLRDNSVGESLILNSKKTFNINDDFVQNAANNVFFATSSVISIASDLNNVSCANDDNTYNKIFVQGVAADSRNFGIVDNKQAVIQNLNNEVSSYSIVGDNNHATTTFGLILKGTSLNRCVLIEFAKKKSDTSDTTESFSIISTGYSSCNSDNKSRVVRTIYRYSTD